MWLAELSSTDRPESAGLPPDTRRPFLVAGQLDVWWLWSAVTFAAVCGFAAVLFWVFRPRYAAIPTATAALAILATFAAFVAQWRRRAWLTYDSDVFRIIDRTGDHEFHVADVAALAVSSKPQHSFGTVVAERHRACLWFSDSSRSSRELITRSGIDEPSPIQPLLQRIQTRLLDRWEAALNRRQSLSGDGWEWRDDAIISAHQRATVRVPIGDISAVDWTTDHLRIWRNAEPNPAITLARGDRDVWLLTILLGRRFGRPGDPGVIRGSGLGRVLRESRSRSAAVMSFSLAVLAATVAGVCFAAAIWLRMFPLALVGGGVGLTAMALLSASLRLWRSSFRFHETGVSQTSLAGHRYLGFSEIDQFAFDARRQYSRGRYLGTLFTMVFVSEGRPRDSIFHTERAPFETDELLQLRERVSEEIASRLARRWSRDCSVAWTRELTLRADSLRFTRRRLFLMTPRAVDLPLAQIRDYEVRGGWFLVWGDDAERALIKTRTSAANFYPGLLLFEQIFQGPSRT